jgi:hypothetical protein
MAINPQYGGTANGDMQIGAAHFDTGLQQAIDLQFGFFYRSHND